MSASYKITQRTLAHFKQPFGVLIEGSFSETANRLGELIEREKPPLIISVGDTVSRNLHHHEIIPHLSITDNLSMRKEVKPQTFSDKLIVRIKNPPGTITQQAIEAIQEALKKEEKTQIVVEGEEDLLTLIAVLHAPENTLVVYGQPHKGIVAVKVTPQKKKEAEKIWKAIKADQRHP